MKNKCKSKKGFTLVELLVVIGIIGVLSAIAAPAALSKVKEAKEKTDVANAASIAMAIKSEWAEGNAAFTDSKISSDDLTALAAEYFEGIIPKSKLDETDFSVTMTDNKVTVATAKHIFFPYDGTLKDVPAVTP